ncbi:MAG: hypothetical protein ACPGSO_07680 [Vicingaceae bacterium]
MTFREIKINELEAFVKSDFYLNSSVIPISPQRAISQSKNPNSKPTDVALILALDKSENIIGYIGLLPGEINNNTTPYFWNSCWWVHPTKGKLAAMPLFYKMLQISNKNMVFFELTETTKNIVAKFKFKTETTKGFKGFMMFNFAQILSRKNNVFKAIKPLISFTDWLLNCFVSIKLSKFKKDKSIKFESITSIDEEAENFIKDQASNQLIPIGKNELDWMIKYPWIKTNPTQEDEQLAKRYFFSSISKSFSNSIYKVYQADKIIAVLFFTIRDNEMKLPYAYFNNDDAKSVTNAIYQIAINRLVNSFTCYNSVLIKELKSGKNPFIFTKELKKNIAYPPNLNVNSNMLQDGDGDAVFC